MYFFVHLFRDAPLLAQGLGLVQLAFTIWMMVDAYHRRVETFWYWVILWFQPVGAWGYFFAAKFRSRRFHRTRGVFFSQGRGPSVVSDGRGQSLAELRFCVERAPTVANRFALAERLMDGGAYAEAVPLLEAILSVEPNYCAVLHALAKCRLATGRADQALAPLQVLLRRDYRWSNYLAWHTLIEVHTVCGRPAEALAACRELVRHQPSLQNKCLLAEQLLGNEYPAEAVKVLDEALVEHRFTPWSTRWHNRRWARKARRIRSRAETDGKPTPLLAAENSRAVPDAATNRPKA